MPRRMTRRRAAGILRRRRDYLTKVAVGKRSSSLPTRHEEEEIEALEVALWVLDSTPVATVTPLGVRSPQPLATQGEPHG